MEAYYLGTLAPYETVWDTAVKLLSQSGALVSILNLQYMFVGRKFAYLFQETLNKIRGEKMLLKSKRLVLQSEDFDNKDDDQDQARSGRSSEEEFAVHLPKLTLPPRTPTATNLSIATSLLVLGLVFFAFAVGMIARDACPVVTNTADVVDGCMVVGYPLFHSSDSCPCLAYKCVGYPLTNDTCLAAAVTQFGNKVLLFPYYVGNYSNAPKGCSVQNNSGTWAAYFNAFDGTNDYGYYTEVRRSAVACTAFQTGTFDPNIMLSLEFDRTLLNTTNANSLTDRFPRARELKLTSNRLQSFQPFVSQGVSRLESLTLEGNNLTLFTISVENFPSMRSLLLQKNELTVLPSELGKLTRLTSLSTNNNRLVVLPSQLGKLTLLKYLWANNNVLTVLPSELGALTSLDTLQVNNNVLTVLPSELGALTLLKYLWANNNVLTVLPSELGALTLLTTLNVYDNVLTVLPSELGALTSLNTLQVINNVLTVLPSELGKLTLLKYLRANNNVLTVLPSELGALTLLTTLNVYENVLTVLPSELGALKKLTELRIQDNKLVAIPAELGSLTSLTLVNLERNRIQCKVRAT
jgi:leucine-rich repeat protein SHOC2